MADNKQWWGISGTRVVGPFDSLQTVKKILHIEDHHDERIGDHYELYRYKAEFIGTAQALSKYMFSDVPLQRERAAAFAKLTAEQKSQDTTVAVETRSHIVETTHQPVKIGSRRTIVLKVDRTGTPYRMIDTGWLHD